ncbi:MAG: Stp1/IreP family PP2C-type Ser/Thr phosphatase [candidate division Zixibacteria bacterium]|nr:Stp1/IreP family PP2C-type Ser/Thr phosphatase [candidate division Zixibacteria bacterium]
MSLQTKVASRTDVGLVRAGNEDYLHVDRQHQVYAVCDGMGGHQAGEVASMTASETIQKVFSFFGDQVLKDTRLDFGRPLPQFGDLLLRSIRLANRAIYSRAANSEQLSGMGTTIVAVAFEADIMFVAHVGDSRVYRLDERNLTPLTRDHSWIEEIQESQKLTAEEASAVVGKNVITRALGVRENVEIDYRIVKVKPGDKFILCSDGLCGFADDDEIFEVADKRRDDLQGIVGDLVQMANDRGGSDNVTVIAIEVEGVDESPLPELEVQTLGNESQEALRGADAWLEELADVQVDDDDDAGRDEEGGGGTNKFLVIGIFVIFAAVAAVIIWMQFG